MGIYVAPTTSTVTIDSVTVTGANDHGIFVQDASHLTISTSTIKDNGVAPTKGINENKAIELVGTSDSVVHHNTVTGNTISGVLDGIWVAGATGTVTSPNTITTAPGGNAVCVVPAPGSGYWLTTTTGEVSSFGSAGFYGSLSKAALTAPVVGMAPTLDQGGYWLAPSNGGVSAFGDATSYGSMAGKPLASPVVGIAATPVAPAAPGGTSTPAGNGHWLVAKDGGVFTFGDAAFMGSDGGKPLNGPVLGGAAVGVTRSA